MDARQVPEAVETPEVAWAERVASHGLHALRDCPEMCAIDPGVERFLFLRHGQTEGNANRIYQSAEITLNDSGRSQAAFAATLLERAAVGRIVASNMQRAWETAAIVGRKLDIEPQPHSGLRERWFGDLIGTSSANLDWSNDPPNGERVGEFVRRTLEAYKTILGEKTKGKGDTLMVAHGGNLYVLTYCLGVELTQPMIQNAAPVEFVRTQAGWTANVLGEPAVPAKKGNLGW
ncbi:MAG TPA: histidine phosphatase family protein [Burkholderiales bacterium]|nr:histidine phosphatase family protein [Burkholderiales bacterium]